MLIIYNYLKLNRLGVVYDGRMVDFSAYYYNGSLVSKGIYEEDDGTKQVDLPPKLLQNRGLYIYTPISYEEVLEIFKPLKPEKKTKKLTTKTKIMTFSSPQSPPGGGPQSPPGGGTGDGLLA